MEDNVRFRRPGDIVGIKLPNLRLRRWGMRWAVQTQRLGGTVRWLRLAGLEGTQLNEGL
jgi:hypothetical protein